MTTGSIRRPVGQQVSIFSAEGCKARRKVLAEAGEDCAADRAREALQQEQTRQPSAHLGERLPNCGAHHLVRRRGSCRG